MMNDYTQISIYDILGTKPAPYKFDKPIRLIELFGGIGSHVLVAILGQMKGSDNNAEHQSE